MGFRLVGNRDYPLTKRSLELFIEIPRIKRDRALSLDRLGKLRKSIAETGMLAFIFATVFCKQNGQRYRVNGNHSSHFLATECSPEQLRKAKAIVCDYEADTYEDVCDLYDSFDPQLSVKNRGDIYNAHAGSCAALDGVSAQTISQAIAGLTISINNDWRSKVPLSEKAKLAPQNFEFVLWLDQLLTNRQGTAKILLRAGVIAAAHRIWQTNVAQASRFFQYVKEENEGTSKKLPTRHLSKFLQTTNVDSGRGARSGVTKSPQAFFGATILAYNAWVQGKGVVNLECDIDDLPTPVTTKKPGIQGFPPVQSKGRKSRTREFATL